MGGHSQKAPAGYQPAYQPQADQGYQNLVNNAMPWATALPGQVIPGLQQAATSVQNNPYFNQAMAGAQGAAGLGQGLSGLQYGGASNLYGMGDVASQYGGPLAEQVMATGDQAAALGSLANLSSQNAIKAGRQVLEAGKTGYGETQGLIPGTTQGAGYAPGMLGNANMLAQLTAGTAMGAIPGLTGGMDAAGRVLDTGFDPQRALYDRSYQQMLEHQNAINSMNGVSGGYAAGLSGDAARNFDIDWQNNQLSRQLAALQGYGQEQGVVAGNLTGLLGSASNNYANLTNAGVGQYTGLTSNATNNMIGLVNSGMGAMATGANAYNQGMNTWLSGVNTDLAALAQQAQSRIGAAGLYSNAVNTAAGAYGAGSQQGIDALQSITASSLAPSQTYLGQQQANISALQALAQGGGAALQPTQGLVNAEGNYLNIGQGATSLAQSAAQINNAQSNAQAAGIGKLVGTVAAIALAPATGGLSLFALGGDAGKAGVSAMGGG